jgi:hypothetical protein
MRTFGRKYALSLCSIDRSSTANERSVLHPPLEKSFKSSAVMRPSSSKPTL